MGETVAIDFRQPKPVFPLPGAVLLPHCVLPLHIFEERYREMTRDALDSHGLITMALFEGEVDNDAYLHGKPPLRPIACIGYCQQYERLDDGRYLIVLRGLCRVRIVEEREHEPYRIAMLQPTEHPPLPDEQLVDERERLEQLITDPALDELDGVQNMRELFEAPIPTAGLIDLLIAGVCEETEQRYRMLCDTDASSRAQWLIHRLDDLRRVLSDGE